MSIDLPVRHQAVGPHRRTAGDRVRQIVQGVGEIILTLGLVVLLFVFYEVYVTNWFSAIKQEEATAALQEWWANPRGAVDRALEEGEGIGRLYVPAFGPDFSYTVLQGTTQDTLAVGPGHYEDTAMPGEPGNFSVAGHRVGKGAPFLDLDQLESCDAMVVETRTEWFVYRMLPMADEAATWARGKGAEDRCQGVAPLPAPYPVAPGQEIVSPAQSEVIAPVPGAPDAALPSEQQQRLITLTTCHPKFSAKQRLIIHGVLVAEYPKGDERPAELMRG
ncbi:MAG: class E sortase [Pseudonocardiaceae bacterium]